MSEERTKHKFLPKELSSASEFGRWKKLMENYFKVHPKMRTIYEGKISFTNSEDGLVLSWTSNGNSLSTTAQQQYIDEELQMNSLVLSRVAAKFSDQLFEIERFSELWARVEETVLGEKSSRLLHATNKLYELRWSGSMYKYIEYFQKIEAKYKALGGSLSDHELAEIVLRQLPSSYNGYVAILRRECAYSESKGSASYGQE